MLRRLEAVWTVLRDHRQPRYPDAVWRTLLGDEHALLAPHLQAVRGRARHWPCGVRPSQGCARRVVEHAPDDVEAVCGDLEPRCDAVRLRGTDLALRALDLRAIAELVVATSGLPVARVTVEGAAVLVGPVPVGGTRLLLAFTTATTGHRLTALAQELRDRHPDGPLLLLAPLAAPPTGPTARLLRMLEVELLPLADVVVADGESLVVDLSAWALGPGSTLTGLDPLPLLAHRHRLVLDPAKHRVGWQGAWHSLQRRLYAERLLLALARSPGTVLPRIHAFEEVWLGQDTTEVEGWEVGLRGHKRSLSTVVGSDLIQTVRGDMFTGGYVLRLPPDQVVFVSEPRE